MAFAAIWMDLEIIMAIEVSQTVRHQHHTLSLACRISEKDIMNFAEQILSYRPWKNLCFPKKRGWGVEGMCQGLGWKCYKIGLWWSLYNYKYNKIHWVILKNKEKQVLPGNNKKIYIESGNTICRIFYHHTFPKDKNKNASHYDSHL